MKITGIKKHLQIIIIYTVLMPLFVFSQKDFYIPKSLIIPVHTQQQELHVSLGFGGGYDANISYSFSKHIAVFATGTLNKGAYNRTSLLGGQYKIFKDDYAIKGGAGYFTVLNKPLLKQYNILETYIGYGNYKVDNYWYFIDDIDLGFSNTKAKFWNIFWQVNLTEKKKKHETTVAVRVAYSKYTDLQFWDTGGPYPSNIKSSYENFQGITIDPAISYSYLLNKFKINIQAGISSCLGPIEVKQINTQTFPNQIITTVNDRSRNNTEGLLSLIGRISLQYNFDLKKK